MVFAVDEGFQSDVLSQYRLQSLIQICFDFRVDVVTFFFNAVVRADTYSLAVCTDSDNADIGIAELAGDKFTNLFRFHFVLKLYLEVTSTGEVDALAQSTGSEENDAYNYGSGKISDYSRTAMLQKMPEPVDNATVLNASADPNHIQVSDPGQVEGNTVFTYLDAFSSDEDFAEFLPDYKNLDELKDHYRRGGLGDVKVKKFLLNVINKELEPIRARRHEYEKDIPEVYNILKKGTEAAYAVAQDTLDDVKAAMKIDYFNDAELIKVQSEKYSRTE